MCMVSLRCVTLNVSLDFRDVNKPLDILRTAKIKMLYYYQWLSNNLKGLTVHLCGFSPVCLRMCTTNIYWALKGFSSREQSSHRQMNDFLFAWMWSLLMCFTSSSCVLNSKVQSRQWQFVSTKSPGSSLRSVVSAAATDSPLILVVDWCGFGRLGSRLMRLFLCSILEGLSASTVVTCECDMFFSCLIIVVEGGVVSR